MQVLRLLKQVHDGIFDILGDVESVNARVGLPFGDNSEEDLDVERLTALFQRLLYTRPLLRCQCSLVVRQHRSVVVVVVVVVV